MTLEIKRWKIETWIETGQNISFFYQRFERIESGSFHLQVDRIFEGGAELGPHRGGHVAEAGEVDRVDDLLNVLDALHHALR